MRLLLDTHIVVWSLLEPARLSQAVASALSSAENELWVSPISVWEIALLAEKGRIAVDDADPVGWLRGALAQTPLRQAALTHEVALVSRSLDLVHQDPADRFIAATALVYELVLVTADHRLLGSRQLRTMAN